MGKQFSIGNAIADALKVSESDTALEQIRLDLIEPDPRNFYSLDGVEELAANIELIGLQQPIRVRENPESPGRYTVVSGHRRREAVTILHKDNPEKWKTVPCIIERDNASQAMQELRLIYANADTRRMKDADIAKQAERVQDLLYQLKEEGIEFPGRMRDHVAEACKVSATKLATLKVIRENLVSNLMPAFEAGRLPTETAYQFAQLPKETQIKVSSAIIAPTAFDVQRIVRAVKAGASYHIELTCPNGKPCTHEQAFIRHDAAEYETCKGQTCCLQCSKALSSSWPCKNACSKAKAEKSARLAKEHEEQDKKAEKENRRRMKIQTADAVRLVKAIDAAGLSDKEELVISYTAFDVKTIRDAAEGIFHYDKRAYVSEDRFKPRYADDLKRNAEKLHCSADYLLGLTEDLTSTAASPAEGVPSWKTGMPPKAGRYYCKFVIDGLELRQLLNWNNTMQYWQFGDKPGAAKAEAECLGWYPLPEE